MSISSILNTCGLVAVQLAACSTVSAGDAPDIRSVVPDLIVPEVTSGSPQAGRRVEVPDSASGLSIIVYLPCDWQPNGRYPVIVELPGNGGYRSPFGDICSGRPIDCNLGYGISAGAGAIWISVPFLNAAGDGVVLKWWGDAPGYDPGPTVKLVKRTVAYACTSTLRGDSQRVILAGFSRGSIACNFVGLYDDAIAGLWRGMVCYSHYDGVRLWRYPGSDRAEAKKRLQRLQKIPQFICHEVVGGQSGLESTREFLQPLALGSQLTFRETGFRNHSSAWVLRPSPARLELRKWYRQVTAERAD